MSVEEALAVKLEGESEDLLTKYNNQYGYYDLFLINNKGYCYYTVCHEADYQTNLVDGKFKDSNFGQLIREVLKTKKFGFADFTPYAPSNGTPAAFIAQPVLDSQGEIDTIVALQLPTEAMNEIMESRVGLGKTGGMYLIAKDADGQSSFRSNLTFMDEKYVVCYKVTTPYIEAALKSPDAEGDDAFTDSHGNGVLVTYTPVDAYGKHWSLVSKINQDEAFAAVADMKEAEKVAKSGLIQTTLLIIVVAIIAIVAVAVVIAISITKPIKKGS